MNADKNKKTQNLIIASLLTTLFVTLSCGAILVIIIIANPAPAAEIANEPEPTAEITNGLEPTTMANIEPTAMVELIDQTTANELPATWLEVYADGSWALYMYDENALDNTKTLDTGCGDNTGAFCDTYYQSETPPEAVNLLTHFGYDANKFDEHMVITEYEDNGSWYMMVVDPADPTYGLIWQSGCIPGADCEQAWEYTSGLLEASYPPEP